MLSIIPRSYSCNTYTSEHLQECSHKITSSQTITTHTYKHSLEEGSKYPFPVFLMLINYSLSGKPSRIFPYQFFHLYFFILNRLPRSVPEFNRSGTSGRFGDTSGRFGGTSGHLLLSNAQ